MVYSRAMKEAPHYLIFDIETQNTFDEVGSRDPADLAISLLVVYDSATDTYTSFLESELHTLWPLVEAADMLVGYNSDHFDIPLLNKYYPGDLTTIKSLDLMVEIQKALGRRLRLDDVVSATLGAKKSGQGLDAIRWWRAGEIEKIRKYCEKDVELTKRLFDYMRENKSIKYKDFSTTRELVIDTATWFERNGASLTHTLGF